MAVGLINTKEYIMSEEKKVMLVVTSKVKAHAKEQGLSIGSDALAKLSEVVASVVTKAGEKAKADKRKTIKDRDLDVE